MNELETLEETTWNEIKVGELFAFNSCWCVFAKISESEWMLLAQDWDIKLHCGLYGFEEHVGGIFSEYSHMFRDVSEHDLYKLPLSVQRLWKCE